MPVLALRGATTVDVDSADAMADAVGELLHTLLDRNALQVSDVISAYFTCTGDLTSAYPALGARQAGWHAVPMLCAVDQPVQGALPRCIRVLLHVHGTERTPRHAYLRDAVVLRTDLADGAP